ncbi:radical SAM protein [Candidatus Borrarchaeum sp.]|uniref:SPL family radical SAM protein n=1 Tax=Candidatus Borrarchaeum sp. TaxID=2846742 RepID=UPI00257F951E|nr:radical SAM protein [Candidatus Borrarchaeum sp.]
MSLIQEIIVKSALVKSRIYDVDYVINPYIGCTHGCKYCYARFMKRYTKHKEPWGEFVDIKTNIANLLSGELARKKGKGLILLSSVTDPYQPVEEKYELTRKCLQRLLRYDRTISILTKSALVTRDIDLLSQFSECEVGFTITTYNDKIREVFEPEASPIEQRISTLRKLHDQGIATYVFLGPIIPVLTEQSLSQLLDVFSEGVIDRLSIDKLNIKAGNWPLIRDTLRENFPEKLSQVSDLLFDKQKNNNYFTNIKKTLLRFQSDFNIPCEFCF